MIGGPNAPSTCPAMDPVPIAVPAAAIDPPVVVVQPDPVVDEITCILTVDNEMRHVSYNDVVIQASGDYASWTAVKTITF